VAPGWRRCSCAVALLRLEGEGMSRRVYLLGVGAALVTQPVGRGWRQGFMLGAGEQE